MSNETVTANPALNAANQQKVFNSQNTPVKTEAKVETKVDTVIVKPEVKAEIEPWKQVKHKVKIDGNELDVDYDDLVKNYQLSKVSLTKMNEAAKQMDMAKATLKVFKENPAQALKELGVDAKQWAEQFLTKALEEDMLSPEEKEKRDLLNKVKSYEDEKKASEKAKTDAEFQQKVAYHQQDISNKMVEALKASGLPATEGTVSRVATYMMQFINAGHNVEPADVIEYVKADYNNEHKQFYADSDINKLIETLGEKKVAEIVKAHTQGYKTKAKQASPKVSHDQGKSNTTKIAKKPTMSLEQKMREIRNKNGIKY